MSVRYNNNFTIIHLFYKIIIAIKQNKSEKYMCTLDCIELLAMSI